MARATNGSKGRLRIKPTRDTTMDALVYTKQESGKDENQKKKEATPKRSDSIEIFPVICS